MQLSVRSRLFGKKLRQESQKIFLASPYWLPIPILTYPLDFWQKIFATGIHQQKNASGIENDKALDQVFSDFQTEHLTFLHFYVGGGGSIEYNGYRFAVHSDESIHKHMPHVHVIKDEESVRYSLITLERIDDCSHVFLRDEKKIILPALKKHLPRLQEFWTAAMGGYRPPEFDFNNKQYYPES